MNSSTSSRKWLFFCIGLIVGIFLMIALPLAVLASGMMNMSAATPAGKFESTIAPWAFDRSMDRHAKKAENPFAGNAKAVGYGLEHYKDNCAVCHGAPGLKPSDIGEGLNPPPPDLWSDDSQELSDGEMFWIVKNGIRMTGMPAFGKSHSDEMIWHMVTFVRHMPKITDAERDQIRDVIGEEEEHLNAGAGEISASAPASSSTQPTSAP